MERKAYRILMEIKKLCETPNLGCKACPFGSDVGDCFFTHCDRIPMNWNIIPTTEVYRAIKF